MQSKLISFFRLPVKLLPATPPSDAAKPAPVVLDQQSQRLVSGGLPHPIW